jgi:hypothetical protein
MALAVILLMTKPMLGLGLATSIIVCDVVINAWVGVTYGFDVASFVAQALFLVFVMSTVGMACVSSQKGLFVSMPEHNPLSWNGTFDSVTVV